MIRERFSNEDNEENIKRIRTEMKLYEESLENKERLHEVLINDLRRILENLIWQNRLYSCCMNILLQA